MPPASAQASQASRKPVPVLRNDPAHLRITLRHAEIAEIETRPDIATQQGVFPQGTRCLPHACRDDVDGGCAVGGETAKRYRAGLGVGRIEAQQLQCVAFQMAPHLIGTGKTIVLPIMGLAMPVPPIKLSPARGITSDLAAVVCSLVEWLVVSPRKGKGRRSGIGLWDS